MMQKRLITAAVGVLVSLIPAVRATVIDFYSYVVGYTPYESECSLTFDFDLQLLNIATTIYDHQLDFDDGHMFFATTVDSYPTPFSVVWNVMNETGVTWTGYDFMWGGPLHGGGPAMIDPESIETTGLQTVYPWDFFVGLSGSPVVPDGESLTIEFSLHTLQYHNNYANMFYQRVIPEPTTIALLGLGGLVLMRNRMRVKA